MNTHIIRIYQEDYDKLTKEIKLILLEKFPDLEKLGVTNAFLLKQVIDYALTNYKAVY